MPEESCHKECLHAAGLKVTSGRLAVLDMLYKERIHPSAEQIFEYVRKNNHSVSFATVYHILDTFEKKKIIKKVSTENGLMRYDGFVHSHYHLVSESGEEIKDYCDDELNLLLQKYFTKKKIEGFQITNINLQLTGKFLKED